MLALFVAGLAAWLAFYTTQRVARHGATGMTAGMAAMMAAMGTGLSVGYAAGLVWDLGWANLAGVVAGFAHGLWMGRRYGPMAALDGAGGGAMGGLMGPMLSIMLVALPLSLVWTAGLMLLLHWAFSVGAVYLVAAAAGQADSRWLALVGRVLGAGEAPGAALPDHYGALGVTPGATTAEVAQAFLDASRVAAAGPEQLAAAREALAVLSDPLRRARYDAARLAAECCPEDEEADPPPAARPAHSAARPSGTHTPAPAPVRARGGTGGRERSAPGQPATAGARRRSVGRAAAFGGVGLALGAAYLARGAAQGTAPAGPGEPVAAAVGPDGVQLVNLTLQAPYYGPPVVEVQRGAPVRVTLTAVGDPG